MPEKLEHCPKCGEGNSKFWLYDFQRCKGCGHDGMNIGFARMKVSPEVASMIRERAHPLSPEALEHAYAAFPPDQRDKHLIASAVRAYLDTIGAEPSEADQGLTPIPDGYAEP